MNAVNLRTSVQPLAKLQAANFTNTDYTARACTLTKPTTGAIDLTDGDNGGYIAQTLRLSFFGVGANDTTFSARVLGWQMLGSTWVPSVFIAGLDVILGNLTGVADCDLDTDDRLADTIAFIASVGAVNVGTIFAPVANSHLAAVQLPTWGCGLITVDFDMTGATSGNALWCAY